MEVEADAAALFFRDLEKFVFEPFSLVDCILKVEVSGFQFGGAFLHTHFEFIVGAPQVILRSTALDELANFAADGSHHVQQIRIVLHALKSKKFENAN